MEERERSGELWVARLLLNYYNTMSFICCPLACASSNTKSLVALLVCGSLLPLLDDPIRTRPAFWCAFLALAPAARSLVTTSLPFPLMGTDIA